MIKFILIGHEALKTNVNFLTFCDEHTSAQLFLFYYFFKCFIDKQEMS